MQGYVDYSFSNSPLQSTQIDENTSPSTLADTVKNFDSEGRLSSTEQFASNGTQVASANIEYDNWGNVIYFNNSVTGQKTYSSYSNTNTSKTFIGTSAFSNSFYTNSGLSPYIHDLLLGTAQFQNGTGSAKQEDYYEYSSIGELVQDKESHKGGWIYANSTYDQYGNLLTSTNALGYTTYYQYSSTYDHAYVTQESIIADGVNDSTTYTYNMTTGWLTSETDPNGHTTTYYYDNVGREIQVVYPEVPDRWHSRLIRTMIPTTS